MRLGPGKPMAMEIVPYGGWTRNARLVSGDLEMVVTLEVGPRILRFGTVGGQNLLKNYPKDVGKTGGDTYHSFGGHRLWIAPEEDPKTMHADNSPVTVTEEDGWTVFMAPEEKWHVQKEIRIRAQNGGFKIRHRIHNRGVYAIELAPWSITVVEVGGVCIFPQSPYFGHPDRLLPVRPVALWGYTNMADPRYTWGHRVIRLRHDANGSSQKIGSLVTQGYATYALNGQLFIKRFGYDPAAQYPDLGCNFETFTREDMLEIESLGGVVTVAPGSYAEHDEAWYLEPSFEVPEDDQACFEAIEAAASRHIL